VTCEKGPVWARKGQSRAVPPPPLPLSSVSPLPQRRVVHSEELEVATLKYNNAAEVAVVTEVVKGVKDTDSAAAEVDLRNNVVKINRKEEDKEEELLNNVVKVKKKKKQMEENDDDETAALQKQFDAAKKVFDAEAEASAAVNMVVRAAKRNKGGKGGKSKSKSEENNDAGEAGAVEEAVEVEVEVEETADEDGGVTSTTFGEGEYDSSDGMSRFFRDDDYNSAADAEESFEEEDDDDYYFDATDAAEVEVVDNATDAAEVIEAEEDEVEVEDDAAVSEVSEVSNNVVEFAEKDYMTELLEEFAEAKSAFEEAKAAALLAAP
jgi:hypothetical protein